MTQTRFFSFALILGVATVALVGCKKADDVAAQPGAEAVATQATANTAPPAPTPQTQSDAVNSAAAAPVPAVFDITSIPVSEKPLPEWPYLVTPTGYHFYHDSELPRQTKDLARVPVWLGNQFLWVEGKVFSDEIDNNNDKTFSKLEVRRNVQQALEALGAVRVTDKTLDEETYKAHEDELEEFGKEFTAVRGAYYWYDRTLDVYVIRRADKAIWFVLVNDNNESNVMVAEGPLPEAPAK